MRFRSTLPSDAWQRWLRRFAGLGIVLVVVAALGLAADWWLCEPAEVALSYVGSERCADCHRSEAEAWRGSHHQLAMNPATPDTVLGDFSDRTLEHFGVTSRMYRDGDRYLVHTEGPDGSMRDFEVRYVFGVTPLQQYLVELEPPTGGATNALGRMQVLRISWDTLGQRWFYLSPPDVNEKLSPDDPLHWTGPAQNWNHMCADCHSTNLEKGYDLASDTYQTTFSDVNVGCEACHGPGSLHVKLAASGSPLWDRRHGKGMVAMKREPADVEIHTCASCHSRRRVIAEGFRCGQNYYDYFQNELLRPDVYYPDGQILDEVYVFGSFVQSKMYAQAVRCTDCHHAHSGQVKYSDNRLCTTCHMKQHDPAKYDTPAHHFHPPGTDGAQCVACHMPATPYMEVDLRRDHGFKIPRPDQSLRLGTPNACTGCHLNAENVDADKRGALSYYADWLRAARAGDEQVQREIQRVDQWMSDTCSAWYRGRNRPAEMDFAETLQRAWNGDPEVISPLLAVTQNRQLPAMVRASALAQLGQYWVEADVSDSSSKLATVARQALQDRDPQVRAEAVSFFELLPAARRLPLVAPQLEDPLRLVRLRSALALVDAPPMTLSESQLTVMQSELAAHEEALLRDADRMDALMALGVLAERRQDWAAAEQHYLRAVRLHPRGAGPRSNLSAVLERTERYQEASALRQEELAWLQRDARLLPTHAELHYRLGLAYYLAGAMESAEASLARSVQLSPNQPDYVLALCLFYQKVERYDDAERLAERLLALRPGSAVYQRLHVDLRNRPISAGRSQP